MPDKQLRYRDSLTAFEESKGDIDVAIGDDRDSAVFQEQIKYRFNKYHSNEFSLSSRLLIEKLFDGEIGERTLSERDGKVKSEFAKVKNEYYDLSDGKEHLTTLFDKPKNGCLEYSFKMKGCEAYHQPPLTDEREQYEAEHGKDIEVTETQVLDAKGNVIANRPPEYVNSWAIYNNQSKGNNIIYPDRVVKYETGKLLHIKRYKAILPDGKEVWLKSRFDRSNLIVDIPDELLRDESLFVKGLRIDPTFGYTTAGGTMEYGDNSGRGCYLYRFSLSEAGDVSKLTHYGSSFNTTYGVLIGLIYSNTSDAPDSRQGYTSETYQNSTTNQWWDLTFSSAVSLTTADWWLGVMFGRYGSTGYYSKAYRDTGTTAYGRYKYSGFSADNTPPATAGTLTSSNHKYSIYATYTAGGGSTFKPKGTFIN